jgi:hypothetical protein
MGSERLIGRIRRPVERRFVDSSLQRAPRAANTAHDRGQLGEQAERRLHHQAVGLATPRDDIEAQRGRTLRVDRRYQFQALMMGMNQPARSRLASWKSALSTLLSTCARSWPANPEATMSGQA